MSIKKEERQIYTLQNRFEAEHNIKTYWGANQGNSTRLREIVHTEFQESLDLVIDDASHMYALTKKSFETLFPLLRPGGLYIIEDWRGGIGRRFRHQTTHGLTKSL
jgi:predicted methyltransferase